uniref:Retrovirus-related Pol polyprotein from transposon TNT 1-94 n=1 Tax=Cajanus cajan TaxID=3821 RepID=A0A151S0K0_CAJCA|nr:hypothetical protein KK1_030022 [Cajanus cajan]
MLISLPCKLTFVANDCFIQDMQTLQRIGTVELVEVDDYSRYVWIFLMKSKDEAQTHLKSFVTFVERQFTTKVKMIRSKWIRIHHETVLC